MESIETEIKTLSEKKIAISQLKEELLDTYTKVFEFC